MNNLQLVGLTLSIASFALLMVSRVQLGKSFAVTPQAKDLVTHGLYSKIRNPMYFFVDLTIVGMALSLRRWYVFLPLVILIPLQIRNARKERKLLSEKFGETYNAYFAQTWF